MSAALVMVCAPVVGLRVPSFCRSPWPPHRTSPIGPLLRTCSRCHSIPVGSPSAPSQKQDAPRPAALIWKQNLSRRVSSIPVSSPLVDAQSPSSFAVESGFPPAQLDSAVVWPVVAPSSAHGNLDQALLLCRFFCLKKTRET